MDSASSIRPFRIDVAPSDLDDLAERLRRTRLPAPLPGDGWDTGVPVAYLRELVDHWLRVYDWRKQEAELNGYRSSWPTSTGSPSVSCMCARPSRTRCPWC